jgi:hypothetical protein
MSKLTNAQIRATISGIETGIRSAISRGVWARGLRLKSLKLDAYRAELMAREAAGQSPGTEIQTRRNGGR